MIGNGSNKDDDESDTQENPHPKIILGKRKAISTPAPKHPQDRPEKRSKSRRTRTLPLLYICSTNYEFCRGAKSGGGV